MPTLSLSTLSALDQPAFVAALEGIFEHTPWVAARAWQERPFTSLAVLEKSLAAVLLAASEAEQLALIRAHPELAGRAAIAGELTAESTREQAGARLDACSTEEFARLQALNATYNAKFGFPFILAVRGFDRAAIIERFAARVLHSREEEFAEALRQILRIASLRLQERFPAHRSDQ
ncbi:2-oxo-4-hydroxy-4-carboxy-5-ureidoimidazoline decarboxylase [Uliginosibacterium aquaticum]|uniref:2-oxo-4-hydroxy-4-carboxy-5-ureidoimidazoline decarboxylase n=1 Tax=Uliginosibacterium aquaticum TaxID=2731212 RepID=A0ABX2IHI8_9RHOO|nr:2-oxo-4-hydroxy-4-carboxy-5-ureidoimidazoline decarboxylase [Uliginosibacterium aquaticum]NSL53831.1 2-oxo-4-hydroxy-4-carboxy-5-ureidoimidazoline decarboxylase [Uliginosibacterium aquaticum]